MAKKQRIVDDVHVVHRPARRCIHKVRLTDDCAECKGILLAAEAYLRLRELAQKFSADFDALENGQ